MRIKTLTPILSIAACSLLLQSSGIEESSALRLREKKPLPPQMVDYTVYDDVLELDCEEKPGYMKFAGAQLTPVVRVRVTCRKDTRSNQYAPEEKYEDLWFKNSETIGCNRFIENPVKERHRIAIFMKQDAGSLTDAEIAACASALIRLRLESCLNRNLLATVRVPHNIFERMKIELSKQNFVSYKENSLYIKTQIPIPLETEYGRREVMSFLPR